MKFRNIVSVSSLPGLYELRSSKTNGAIVVNLDNLTTKFISARLHSVTPLESVEVFTTGENMPLYKVLELLKSVDEKIVALDFKNQAAFEAVFAEGMPEYDKERVYMSDVKKILKWYLLLKKNDLLDFSEYFAIENDVMDSIAENASNEQKEVTEKPKKKKSTAESTTSETETAEKKPAKKTSTKKAAVASDEAEAEKKTPAKKTATKKAAAKKKSEE